MTQAMMPGARRAQRAQCPRFLFGAKEASTYEESRGIRQMFPYRCNETKARRAPARIVSLFPFGAKGASSGAENRGVKHRFPYWCSETKTSRTAGRRSRWSPRRRHHQSLWQAKTAFVRIRCTSCPLSIFGERTKASINRTSHHRS